MNVKRFSRLLAVLLLLTMVLSLCPAALAADAETTEEAAAEELVAEEVVEAATEEEAPAEEVTEEEEPAEEAAEEEEPAEEEPKKELSRTLQLDPNSYEADQSYSYTENAVDVFTVQLSSGFDPVRAEEIRDGVLAKGFDAFIYWPSGPIYTMSGKFDNLRDALAYAEAIHVFTDRSTAYVVNAQLPQEAVQSFQDVFYSSCLVSDRDRDVETFWEIPTGDFFRADEGTVEVFTVQFSSGTSFHGSERNRDAMAEQGYPAFVYKTELMYKTMTGMFYDYKSALDYCATIRSNTDQDDAVVRTAKVPASAVKEFQKKWK